MPIIPPSGNPYQDAGFEKADELMAKFRAIEFLHERLAETGMTQAELARQAGLAPSHVSEMLAGKLARFGIDRINRALAVFGASLEVQYRLKTAA